MKIQFAHNAYRELLQGEQWMPHPEGGIIVTHPERKPLRCYVDAGMLRQEWIEPSDVPCGFSII